MTLYLLNYNNYYNRIIKYNQFLDEYPNPIGSPIYRVNFNPNDGVNTEQIINWPTYNETPNYLLVCNEDDSIDSRWFIIESQRTRAGQYKLTLHRDLIADFIDPVIEAPMFIEKATLPISNNLIFNNENMTYNQLLDRKIALKDETKVPWVVGYIPRDSFIENKKISITSYASANSAADFETAGLANWSYYRYILTPFYPNDEITLNVSMGWRDDNWGNYNILASCLPGSVEPIIVSTDRTNINTPTVSGGTQYIEYSGGYINKVKEWSLSKIAPFTSNLGWDMDIRPALESAIPGIASKESTRYFKNLDGKTIKDTTNGKVYDIEIQPLLARLEGFIPINGSAGTTLKNRFTEKVIQPTVRPDYPESTSWPSTEFTANSFGYTVNGYNIKLTQRATTADCTLNNNRYHLEDAPYDMFCIPAKDIDIYKNGSFEGRAQGSLATAVATAIGAETGKDNLYDIQLLPYCPVRYLIDDSVIDIKEHPVHPVEDEDGNPLTYILWATSSTAKFNIDESIRVPENNIEFKVANETEFFRLVSPNGNGMYEFTPTKNDGVDYFEVDFTYKPFSPYIHVKPAFRRLNGENPDKDFRGLICGGDFSITQLSNAWANYQLQNVNYQNIFARQIENMNVNNSIGRQQDIANAIFGSVGGGVSGATTGAFVGGGWGAAAGGIAGTALSAAGGALDISINEQLRAEALDYTRDQFGYQLGNIQALPTSISKTGAQVYTNTLFPMLEYYRATHEETTALRNKIKYNGMTVGVIGRIQDFLQSEPSYIKGKLIRLEIAEDYHLVNAISGELDKGVYI